MSGNKLLNANGQQVILRGVNRSGAEYSCVNGTGIFDGEMDQAAINAIKSWGSNVVRMPLNEACWNGESYVNSQFSGANYQNAIKSEVSLMNASGLDVILDLHWTDGTATAANCSSVQAVCQKPMPDAAQAIPFWSSVATAFKGNDAVIFDLFNEPFASRSDNNNTAEGWQCWETGSPCTGINYPVAGMQQMITAVRNAGANNVIMLGGEEFSNDLTELAAVRADRPRPQPGRVLAFLQLQHLQQPVVLDLAGRPGDRASSGDRGRDRRERLLRQLHQPAHHVAGLGEHQLPRLGLERRLPAAQAAPAWSPTTSQAPRPPSVPPTRPTWLPWACDAYDLTPPLAAPR